MASIENAFDSLQIENYDYTLQFEQTPNNNIFYDLNQMDKTIPRMLNGLKKELEDIDSVTDLVSQYSPQPDTYGLDLAKLEHDVAVGKEILTNSIEMYSKNTEDLTKLTNADALSRNLLMALQVTMDKVCHLSRTTLDIQDDEITPYIDAFKESIKKIENTISNAYLAHKKIVEENKNTHLLKIRQLVKTYKTIKEVNSTHICPICLSSNVESFLIPCGHTFCDKCIKKIRLSCFICRQEVQRVSQLFFT